MSEQNNYKIENVKRSNKHQIQWNWTIGLSVDYDFMV